MPKREQQPRFYTKEQLAELIHIPLSALIEALNTHPHYAQFAIPKRSGGNRIIEKPPENILQIQRSLDRWLRTVYRHPANVHGFVRDRSIITNAKEHVGRAYILNIDIKDFFPTIQKKRVTEVFQRPPFNLANEMADVIATLCCYRGSLPQGAPTSPIVSNIVCWSLDLKLSNFAKKHGYIFTRYADDITISSHPDPFPLYFGKREGSRFVLGEAIETLIQLAGFQVNPDKVYLRTRKERQEVTGVIVNEKPNVSRRYVNQVRAMLHSLRVEGEEVALQRHLQLRPGNPQVSSFSAVVRGKIEFVGMVRGKEDWLYRKLLGEFEKIGTRRS